MTLTLPRRSRLQYCCIKTMFLVSWGCLLVQVHICWEWRVLYSNCSFVWLKMALSRAIRFDLEPIEYRHMGTLAVHPTQYKPPCRNRASPSTATKETNQRRTLKMKMLKIFSVTRQFLSQVKKRLCMTASEIHEESQTDIISEFTKALLKCVLEFQAWRAG